ncbi:MAG: helix-turn-helix domain-containing protein [Phycisphaera sp.]|nr:helix-turn-helix domain-containing protein [Phycisphaera sp.]
MGITDYMRTNRPWSCFLDQRDLFASPPGWLKRWQGDGIICRTTSPKLLEALKETGVPIVDLNDIHESFEGVPKVQSDDRAIGRVAAQHLIERGFRRFGFCGFADHRWSCERRDGFVAALTEAGHECAVQETTWSRSSSKAWEAEQQTMVRWVDSLPKPAGVMACNDMRGRHVLDACGQLDIAVPEALAVVGCDNDDLLCGLCSPPLSSVVPNAHRVGYEAAALLDRLMRGEAAEPPPPIEPMGVITRQSTDVLAIEDGLTARAVRFIRERACDGVSVEDVLDHLCVSRSVLERKMRDNLGRSPRAEIRNVQVKRVKDLLTTTDLPLSRIAELAGYKHDEYMSVVFKRETGVTPGDYRRDAQAQ